MALPTKGRVVIDTTVGEIDIELWSKETPKTCRNFLALAMEGYYDGVIFHRVVPNFLVQTGDKTGTGAGGESFYGEPFEDEIHPRLRFAHRGIVGMANNGTKNSNDSQFFITLDRADELHGKHTLFGRCVGDTVYNVMKIGELELGENDRPVYPPKIKSIRIVDNPFDDIVPRITAAERRVQLRAREAAHKEREDEERRRSAKKNVKLLSFADDEEDLEDESLAAAKSKAMFRPDLVDQPQSVNAIPDFVSQIPGTSRGAKSSNPEESKAKAKKKDEDILKIREKHHKEKVSGETARKAEIEKMEAEVRKLARRADGDDSDEEHAKKKPKKSYLEEELSKYAKGRGLNKKGKRKDESDVLAALNSFRGKLQQQTQADEDDMEVDNDNDKNRDGESAEDPVDKFGEDAGIEVDDDRGFMGHALRFPKGNEEETAKAERDYEVIDPRQRGARAREEEREKKKAMKRGRGDGRFRR
ncbi:cyclophilin-like protein [Pluteus cervinus]|uniref:Cyclophilin-like protein n=1 Tax=Pluteus cervinus TaxID=181527 RepID=A0ACD3ARM1_9AGAR|nr:cyclophilin-like protein [Pluteus cervinus]